MSPGKQITFDFHHLPALGREDFLVTESNEAAVLLVNGWGKFISPLLTVVGPAGSGKSHLAAVWAHVNKAYILQAEDVKTLTSQQIAALGTYIVIEDVDDLLEDRDSAEKLFHIWNTLMSEKRTMLVTMKKSPQEIKYPFPDIRSRWEAAPVATIKNPDDALLGALLVKQFSDRHLIIADDVLQYTMSRMERSFAAARSVVETTDRLALEQKKPVSKKLMREVLDELHQPEPHQPL